MLKVANECHEARKSKNWKILRNKFSEEILSLNEESFNLSFITDTTRGNNMLDTGGENFGNGMSEILEQFNMDVKNLMMAKRKGMKQLVKVSIAKTTEKVSETDKIQLEGREKLTEQFKSEFYSMVQQTKDELEKIKHVEIKVERVLNIMKKKKKMENNAYLNRLEEFKQLNKEFFKDIHELDQNHLQQYHEMIGKIRKDVSVIEKTILFGAQKKEMKNIRKQFKL